MGGGYRAVKGALGASPCVNLFVSSSLPIGRRLLAAACWPLARQPGQARPGVRGLAATDPPDGPRPHQLLRQGRQAPAVHADGGGGSRECLRVRQVRWGGDESARGDQGVGELPSKPRLSSEIGNAPGRWSRAEVKRWAEVCLAR